MPLAAVLGGVGSAEEARRSAGTMPVRCWVMARNANAYPLSSCMHGRKLIIVREDAYSYWVWGAGARGLGMSSGRRD